MNIDSMSLTASIVNWIVSLFQAYGPWSVFVGVLTEEIILPIPSQIILMAAGFGLIPSAAPITEVFLSLIYNVVIPGAIAGTIGSFFAYGIGYYGGKPLISRFSRFVDAKWEDVEKTGKNLGKGKKLWVSIFLSRAIPILPVSVVSVACGVLRVDWKKFALSTFIGQIPRAFILGFLGWYLGSAYIAIAKQLGAWEDVIIVIIIFAVIGFVLWKRSNRT